MVLLKAKILSVVISNKIWHTPQGAHHSWNTDYDSYRVSVSWGTVYLKLGSKKYRLNVDSDNKPTSIEGYGEKQITLY